MRHLVSISVLALLAACGGASTGGTVLSSPSASPIELIRSDADRIAADIQAGGVSPGAGVTTIGSATYTGIAAFGFLAESSLGEGIGGRVDLTVDFEGNPFSGEITDLYSREGDARAGEYTISDGQLMRSSAGVLLSADLSGTMEFLGEVRNFEGAMLGAFAGATGGNISGTLEVEAEFDLPGGTTAAPIILDGGFVLERR